MPKTIVINTGPLIALIAALGDLTILQKMYNKVVVPYEVSQELLAKGKEHFDANIFTLDNWLDKREKAIKIEPFLNNSLDKGEAAVIQTAINDGIKTVCIDEAVGRFYF
jgi:predicted nucleic acid-binding protein